MSGPQDSHRPTSSTVTEDSGLECLTPHDSSADELEDHQRQEVRGSWSWSSTSPRPTMLSSAGIRSATPTSINTDSEIDDAKVIQPTGRTDGKSAQ